MGNEVTEIKNNSVSSEVMPPDIQGRIKEAKKQNNALMQMMDELLQEDVDYGKVPGVPKPFLFQSGAQQLGLVFKFRYEFEKIDSEINFEQDPTFISYEYKCQVYQKETDMFMGEGVGSANNYEKKFRYYSTGEEFEDPLDKQNTLKKMSKKRALVDAVLNVTGASRLFTQDKDLVEYEDVDSSDGNKEPGEFKMPFGKNKGTKLKVLDEGYLNWIANKMEAKNEKGKLVKEMAEKYIKGKNNKDENDKPKKKKLSERQKEIQEITGGEKSLIEDVKEYLEQEGVERVDDLNEDEYEVLKNSIEFDSQQTDE